MKALALEHLLHGDVAGLRSEHVRARRHLLDVDDKAVECACLLCRRPFQRGEPSHLEVARANPKTRRVQDEHAAGVLAGASHRVQIVEGNAAPLDGLSHENQCGHDRAKCPQHARARQDTREEGWLRRLPQRHVRVSKVSLLLLLLRAETQAEGGARGHNGPTTCLWSRPGRPHGHRTQR